MAWRLARSLDVLRDGIHTVAPGTTVWTIGDEDHQDDWSDHNPNAADVVCAADILSNAGLDLAWLVATITATDPPALKYVIYRDRIWFPQTGWQPYRGPFHSHVHVSVGWGPDGRSTGPYDDTSPWGLTTQEDEMTPQELLAAQLDMTNPAGGRWSFGEILGKDSITVKAALGYAAAGGWQLQHTVVPLVKAIAAAGSGLTEAQITAAVRAALDPEELADLIAERVDRDLDRVAVAAALREVLGGLDEEA